MTGNTRVDYVEVVQNHNHMSHRLKLSRGPIAVRGKDCGMQPYQTLCEPTQSWTVEQKKEDWMATFDTTCGDVDTQYFGEIMTLDVENGKNWQGSYADDNLVPSACHCLQLCVAHIQEGCR